MYSQNDATVNDARIKKIVCVLVIALILGIVALVPTLMYRIQWATDLVSCLFGAFIIFFWQSQAYAADLLPQVPARNE